MDDLFARLPPHTYQFDIKTRTGSGHTLANRAARADVGRAVFALVTRDPDAAGPYMQAARDWLSTKATVEAHEFKLPAALFEDYELVSPEWRPRLLAASAHWLHGRQSPDSPLLRQAREAVAKL
jgi:lysozyme family protein